MQKKNPAEAGFVLVIVTWVSQQMRSMAESIDDYGAAAAFRVHWPEPMLQVVVRV